MQKGRNIYHDKGHICKTYIRLNCSLWLSDFKQNVNMTNYKNKYFRPIFEFIISPLQLLGRMIFNDITFSSRKFKNVDLDKTFNMWLSMMPKTQDI